MTEPTVSDTILMRLAASASPLIDLARTNEGGNPPAHAPSKPEGQNNLDMSPAKALESEEGKVQVAKAAQDDRKKLHSDVGTPLTEQQPKAKQPAAKADVGKKRPAPTEKKAPAPPSTRRLTKS